MPSYANPLYANGVPTYSNEVGALADVFKALAPNPLRDLQIQGYASNARLHQLQGDVIQNQQGGLSRIANAMRGNNYQEIGPAAIESGNLQYLDNIYKAGPAQLAMRGLMPGQQPLSDAEQQAVSTAVGATGGNVANTFYGFGRTADEIARNNNMVSVDRRRGDDLQLSGVLAGVNENRRFHDLTTTEDYRNHNLINSAAMAGVSEDARNHNLINSADMARVSETARDNIQRDKTTQRGQEFDQQNKYYESNVGNLFKNGTGAVGTGGGTGSTGSSGSAASEMNEKDVEQLQAAGATALNGLNIPEARKAEFAARVQANYLAQPKGGRNYQLAANQAVTEMQAGSDLASSTIDNWGPNNDLAVKSELPPMREPWQPPAKTGARGADGLTPLARTVVQSGADLTKPLSTDQLRGPAIAPAAAPAGLHPDLIAAKNAVASGKSRQAVIQRLIQSGRTPQEIQAAGI